MKTLKETCAELNVTRRAVQGYEAAGLVKATRKNKYGYLLYNQHAQERIERIKFFQDLGFSIREIADLIDAPKEVLKLKLEEQVQKLTEELDRKVYAIQKAKALIEELDEQEELREA